MPFFERTVRSQATVRRVARATHLAAMLSHCKWPACSPLKKIAFPCADVLAPGLQKHGSAHSEVSVEQVAGRLLTATPAELPVLDINHEYPWPTRYEKGGEGQDLQRANRRVSAPFATHTHTHTSCLPPRPSLTEPSVAPCTYLPHEAHRTGGSGMP